ncbi:MULTISPECIES: sugar-binding transcriptional regulator [Anaerostipes]|uniref:Transcriptional regulator n=1 Tax=Anaerostipes butyraticus TaxID=645466 RepID=A0A916VD63_9FIRM|nr:MULTISPECIES: sugar-binding transcriptional regulator [Anaerostipes]GFO85465.1 transcriptional regulator [Anaerostipes butyraticus]
MREERFIIKVVEMHYKQGLSQQEIGKKLNVSRTTISRTLAQARREGYVQIKINYPEGSAINLEGMLEEKFQLKEVVIASAQNEKELKEEVAFYASDYLLRTLKNHVTLALTRGVTLQNMVEYLGKDIRLKFLKTDDVNVVPLLAATNISISAPKSYRMAYSNYLIEEVARILNGNSYQMLAPQYVTSPESKEVFMNEKSIKEVFDLAKNADIAVVGIGTLDHNSALINAELIPIEEFQRLQKKGGTGEILSHVVDKDGNVIRDQFEQHLLSLDLEDFKKIPVRVGVTYGMDKKDAILSALRGGYVNVLITDEKVARYLIEENEK